MKIGRVLAVTPHGDDVTLFAGGTLAKWTGDRCEALVVRVTNDEKDSFELGPDETVRTNRLEFEEAMKILGVGRTVHLMYRDCELMDAPYGGLREKLIRHIRGFRPDVILSFDPSEKDEENPDHSITATAAADAAWAAGYPLFHPEHREEGLMPHLVKGCYFFTRHFVKGDHAEDISGALEIKVRAAAAHRNMMRAMLADQKRRVAAAEIDAPAIARLDLDRHGEYWEKIVSASAMMAARGSGHDYAERFRCTVMTIEDPLAVFWASLSA
jgi:LmbE family N-acetylglucosaminyl deacetylase